MSLNDWVHGGEVSLYTIAHTVFSPCNLACIFPDFLRSTPSLLKSHLVSATFST